MTYQPGQHADPSEAPTATMVVPEPTETATDPQPPPPRRDSLPSRRGGAWRAVGAGVLALALAGGGFAVGVAISNDEAGTTVASEQEDAGSDINPPDTLPAEDEPAAAVAATLTPSVVQLESAFGLGSGVVYDESGLILTAAHVVDGAEELTVRLSDGTRVEGTVVGTDAASDVAVVQIEHEGLTVAPLALDAELQVGQAAIAIGSPFGLDGTVTAGVISAVDRSYTSPNGSTQLMIQTDAPINPGNSGGALADRQGRVIGINDAIFSLSGGNQGVGFAIPIDRAKQIADSLVSGQDIRPGYLGLSGTDSEGGRAGALIETLEPGAAAEVAGLEVGDLVVAIDGTPIDGIEELAGRVRGATAGDQVTLTVVRDNLEIQIEVTLDERPAELG